MKRFGSTLLAMLGMTVMLAAQAPAASDILGDWEITTVSPVGENTNTVEFKRDGEVFKAVAKSAQGERPYDSATVDGSTVTLVLTINFQGQPMTITYTGTLTKDSIDGSADFGGMAQGSFSAKRKPADPTR